MLGYWGETLPKETSPATREMGVLGLRWMVDKRMERNDEMKRKEVMGEGERRRVFQDGIGPDDVFNFGKHQGRTCPEV